MSYERECMLTITICVLVLTFCAGIVIVRQHDLKHQMNMIEQDIRRIQIKHGVVNE